MSACMLPSMLPPWAAVFRQARRSFHNASSRTCDLIPRPGTGEIPRLKDGWYRHCAGRAEFLAFERKGRRRQTADKEVRE